MVWNASGAERVKSYRVYQELEAKYHEALEHIRQLQQAVTFKDGLIRSLATEIAMLPQAAKDEVEIQRLFQHAAEVQTQATDSSSGTRPVARPGSYSQVGLQPPSPLDGTSEEDEPREAALTARREDPVLAGIPSPPSKKRKQ